MNTRQAAAFRELIRHEERSRDKWNLLHSTALNSQTVVNTNKIPYNKFTTLTQPKKNDFNSFSNTLPIRPTAGRLVQPFSSTQPLIHKTNNNNSWDDTIDKTIRSGNYASYENDRNSNEIVAQQRRVIQQYEQTIIRQQQQIEDLVNCVKNLQFASKHLQHQNQEQIKLIEKRNARVKL